MITEGRNENGRVLRRDGVKCIYQLQEGEDWLIYCNRLFVVHPDRPPKVIYPDGTVEECKL